jgi:hypothetical protein
MSQKGWSRKFDDAIPLPGGRQFVTLRDAGNYITRLPKAEHDAPHWQLAMQCLLAAAEHGAIVMMARIALAEAMNHGKPKPATAPRRKRAKA